MLSVTIIYLENFYLCNIKR